MTTHQGPRWGGTEPPEQADTDMMARYRRALIEDAARTPKPIDWMKGLYLLGAVAVAVAVWVGVVMAVRHAYRP